MKTRLPDITNGNVKPCYSTLVCGLLSILLLMLFVLSSCNLSKEETNHTKYFESVVESTTPLLRSGKINSAFRHVDSAYTVFPGVSDHDMYIIYGWKAAVLYNMSDFKAADAYADSMLLVVNGKQGAYRIERAGALLMKGNILVKRNEYNNAYASFYEGRELILEQADTCALGNYSSALAFVLYKQKKYRDAAKFWLEEFRFSEKCDTGSFGQYFVERQGTLDNAGLCYERLELYDSAILFYNMALRFIDENESRFPAYNDAISECRIVIKGNLGNVYLKQGRYTEAEQLFKENIAYNRKDGYDNMDGQLTIIKLGELYVTQKRFDEAAVQIDYIRQILDKAPNAEEELRWRKLVWHYYDAQGLVNESFRSYKNYVKFSDSIDAAERELPGADFNKTFDHLSQAGEISSLKRQKTSANRILIIIGLFAAMAIVIIYLVYRNYIQSKSNLTRQTKLNDKISAHNVTMQKTLNALEQSQQNNTRMMRVVAHDLHNPVAAMASLIDLLSDGDYDEEQKEMFQMLATSGNNALKLIGDILHTKPAMEMERLRLDELLTYSVGLMQFKANEKKQALLLHVEQVTVMADREKIWRVINNLIVNAIKFSYSGKAIDIALVKKGGNAVLSIRDEGVGMSPTIKGEIFQHFSVGGTAGTSGEESFGLGLSISKQIIDAHGGKIWFESEVGKGTTFYVELKYVDEQEV